MEHVRLKSDPHVDMIPKAALRAMFGLVLAVLVLVSLARFFDAPLVATPEDAPIIVRKSVTLTGQMSGAAQVYDAKGQLIADLSPEKGGFISGVSRVLDRERQKHGQALDGPVDIIWRENGRISLFDPSTGWTADLMGFGADNARAFANLVAKTK